MKENRSRSFEWAQSDSIVGEATLVFAEMTWSEIHADFLPPGLDYFLFDLAQSIDVDTATSWLRRVLGLPHAGQPLAASEATYAASYDPEPLMDGVEMLWRRRLKSSPNWVDVGRKQTNHINRVKHRALKLIYERASAVA